jgi:hypothetical protein
MNACAVVPARSAAAAMRAFESSSMRIVVVGIADAPSS